MSAGQANSEIPNSGRGNGYTLPPIVTSAVPNNQQLSHMNASVNPVHDSHKRFMGSHEDKIEQSIFGIRASKNQSNQVQSVARKLENSVRTIERIVSNLNTEVSEQDKLITSTISSVTRDYLDKYRISDQDGLDNTQVAMTSQISSLR